MRVCVYVWVYVVCERVCSWKVRKLEGVLHCIVQLCHMQHTQMRTSSLWVLTLQRHSHTHTNTQSMYPHLHTVCVHAPIPTHSLCPHTHTHTQSVYTHPYSHPVCVHTHTHTQCVHTPILTHSLRVLTLQRHCAVLWCPAAVPHCEHCQRNPSAALCQGHAGTGQCVHSLWRCTGGEDTPAAVQGTPQTPLINR